MKKKIIFGLMGFVSLVAASVANAATVSLTPSVNNIALGDTLTLTVQGTDFINDVSSGSVLVTWDAAQLTMTSSLADIAGSASANGFPLDFGVNTLVPGQLSATYASLGTVAGPTFDFFSINFVANPPPGTDTVSIGAGLFGDWQDGAGVSITGVIYNGATVNVSAVPVPAAVWLFGSGLLGLVGVARRRQVA